MHGIDILTFCLSVLGIYGLILYLRYLIPRNVIPLLSTLLDETRHLLDHAEAVGAVPRRSEYTTRLNRSADRFTAARMENNRARGIFQQLRLVLLRGLTYKLYFLYHEIEDIKLEIEMAVDKQRLAIASGATSSTAMPDPFAVPPVTSTSGSSVIETTLPMPATSLS